MLQAMQLLFNNTKAGLTEYLCSTGTRCLPQAVEAEHQYHQFLPVSCGYLWRPKVFKLSTLLHQIIQKIFSTSNKFEYKAKQMHKVHHIFFTHHLDLVEV